MKHLILNLLAVAALSAAQGKQTFIGTITDNMCAKAGHSQMRMGPTEGVRELAERLSRDGGVIEGRERPRFEFEARQSLRIMGEGVRQNLDGDLATEVHVSRPINPAHAALPEQGGDLVVADTGTRTDSHSGGILRDRSRLAAHLLATSASHPRVDARR